MNAGVRALLGAVLLSGVAGWWLTRISSPATPVTEVSGLGRTVQADLPTTVTPASKTLPVRPAVGPSQQPLDADEPMAYGEGFTASAPQNVGEPMDADDPLAHGEDFTLSAPVDVGEPMDADDSLENDEVSSPTESVNVGEIMDADDPLTYGADSASSAPVNVGEPMDADQEFLADNQQ